MESNITKFTCRIKKGENMKKHITPSHIPAAQDLPYVVAMLQSLLNSLTNEVAILQARLLTLERKGEHYGK